MINWDLMYHTMKMTRFGPLHGGISTGDQSRLLKIFKSPQSVFTTGFRHHPGDDSVDNLVTAGEELDDALNPPLRSHVIWGRP